MRRVFLASMAATMSLDLIALGVFLGTLAVVLSVVLTVASVLTLIVLEADASDFS